MDMLTVTHVKKRFGSREIIKDLSFSVPEHTIYGFLGQNGAGKTTTMKMILGLYPIDSGEIFVNGEKVTYGQNKTNRYIGYLPDVPEFYNYMTPYEYLNLCGQITGMSPSTLKSQITELLELVGLASTKQRIQGFSRGMKQRLGIAQALLNKPKLLICDEPTSALDPLGRKEILDILLSVKDRTTVIFSTHILSDVERICDEIGVIHNGTLSLHGTMEEIHANRRSDGFEIEFRNGKDADYFTELSPEGIRQGKTQIIFPDKKERDMEAAMGLLYQHHIIPQKIELREPTLESLFMEVISK